MTALEYMQKQLKKHRANYAVQTERGAPTQALHDILAKIGYYEAAVAALELQGGDRHMAIQTGVVEITCVNCQTKHTVLVPTAGYRRWASGQARIQDALPELNESERELLMSHICPRCWDKLFGGE